MNERTQQLIEIPIKLLLIGLCAFLYSYGGFEGTSLGWRRVGAPLVFTAGLYYIHRSPLVIVSGLLTFASMTLGYGAHQFWEKIAKRAVFGGLTGLSANSYGLFTAWQSEEKKKWISPVFGIILALTTTIVFGVFNPISARLEEALIGFVIFGPALLTAEKEE